MLGAIVGTLAPLVAAGLGELVFDQYTCVADRTCGGGAFLKPSTTDLARSVSVGAAIGAGVGALIGSRDRERWVPVNVSWVQYMGRTAPTTTSVSLSLRI